MTDQTSNERVSRRLRREQERRRLAAEQGQPLPVDPAAERSRRDDPSPDPSPVERSWRDDVAPQAPVERGLGDGLTPRSSPPELRAPTLSRRELRERAAAGGSEALPAVDDTRTTRRQAEPVQQDWAAAPPAEAPPERPLSRRELRERAATESGENVASRPWREETPASEGPGHAPAGRRLAGGQGDEPLGRDLPNDPPGRRAARRDAPWDNAARDTSFGAPTARRDGEQHADQGVQRDARGHDAPRSDAPQFDAPRSEAPAPVAQWAPSGPTVNPTPRRDPGPPNASGSERRSADVEAVEGPSRPVQPARASTSATAERVASPEVRASAPQPEPAAENAPEPLVPAAPTRISPQARAAAIRAQAARALAEREGATREHYEKLEGRRAAAPQGVGPQAGTPNVGAHTQPAGQPPATMWGRQESNGAPQSGAVAEAAGYEDRPPVRRVVLPPSASAGTGPSDVPVLGQWQAQPQQYQAAAAPQQHETAAPTQQQAYPAAAPQQHEDAAPTQQQNQVAAAPQQYQGIPSGGPMPANGQPFATVTMVHGETRTATAPARPGGGPGGPPNVDGSGPLPRWGSVSASGAWSPAPSNGPNGPNGQAPVGPMPQAMPGATSEATAGATGETMSVATGETQPDDDDDDSAHHHPYTWLHMIVLVLVAFVLGMLIFMLVMKDTTENGAAAAPERVTAASLEQFTERVGD